MLAFVLFVLAAILLSLIAAEAIATARRAQQLPGLVARSRELP